MTTKTPEIQHYGPKGMPIDIRVVNKLRQLAMHAHTYSARRTACTQSARQIHDAMEPKRRQLDSLNENVSRWASNPANAEHVANAQRQIAEIDAACEAQNCERALMLESASRCADSCGRIKLLVGGIVKELGVTHRCLSIDFVDHDIRSGGTTRGIYAAGEGA